MLIFVITQYLNSYLYSNFFTLFLAIYVYALPYSVVTFSLKTWVLTVAMCPHSSLPHGFSLCIMLTLILYILLMGLHSTLLCARILPCVVLTFIMAICSHLSFYWGYTKQHSLLILSPMWSYTECHNALTSILHP